MKKLLTIIATLAIATGAFAQENKMWLGGSASFSASGTATVSIAPTFGYFVTDDISVEGTMALGFGSHHGSYGINAAGRYWLPIGNTPLVYTPGITLGLDIDHYSNLDHTTTDFGFGIQLGAFHYRISPKMSVSANLCGFSLRSIGNNNTTNFSLTTATTLSLNYFF